MELFNDDSLSTILMEIIRLHHKRAFLVFGKYGISRGQPPILSLLRKQDGRTQSEFADILHLEAATVTDCLQRMEKTGLITRMSDPDDLRKTRVFLTKKGKDIRLEIEKVFKTMEEECFKGLNSEEKTVLRNLLIKIRKNLIKVEGSGD